MKTRLPTLTFLAALAGALPQMAAASQVVMNFEGLSDGAIVGNFYNNSDASDVNVTFIGAMALLPSNNGGTGNFTGRPAGEDTVVTNPGQTIELLATDLFDRLDFLYSADQQSFSVHVYDSPDITTRNEFQSGGTTFDPMTGVPKFSSWATGSIVLSNNFKGKFVVFSGSSNLYLLDNVTLTTNAGGGGGTVPEPTSLALVALALAGVGAATRRHPGA